MSADELLDLRADVAAGRGDVTIEDGSFALSDHRAFLAANADDIARVRSGMEAARAEERARGPPTASSPCA